MTGPYNIRHQPPAESVPERPERVSVTGLDRFSLCPRSYLLGLLYDGGAPSGAMARGSLFHAVVARLTEEAMEQGEEKVPPDVAKAALAEMYATGDYVVPASEWDLLRVSLWHWAEHFIVKADEILGVEQLMVWDVGGWRLSGKVDLASVDGKHVSVTDYKTGFAIPTQEAFDSSLQTIAYACMLAYGTPVTIRECECQGTGKQLTNMGDTIVTCPFCDGRGRTEEVEPYPLGHGAEHFTVREVYPAILFSDPDRLATRERTLTRAELLDERTMIEALVQSVAKAFETGRFDAIPGETQCSRCPCRKDCPLPEQILPYAGSIESVEEAQHFAFARALLAQESKDVNAAVKKWIEQNGPIPLADGVQLELKVSESVETDRKKLNADIESGASVTDLAPYLKKRSSSRLSEQKVDVA